MVKPLFMRASLQYNYCVHITLIIYLHIYAQTLHVICLALYEDRRRHIDRGEEMPFVLRAGLQSPGILTLLEAATENTTVMQNPSLADLLIWTIKVGCIHCLSFSH